MRLVTTFIQNTESTDPDLSYLNRARFVLSVADGHGSDGVGILDAVIRNRHLFLSMTSGAEIDAGSVFTEDDLPVASDSRLGIAAFDPAYFSILAGKVSLRGDLDFGLNETQLAEYLTANKYATQAWVAAQGFIGSDGLALYATKEWVLGQNFAKASSLGNYLLKSVWDEVFEVTTVNGVRVLNVKLDIAGLKGISAYGLGSTSGSGASGSLGELVNVGQWADEAPAADRVMVQLAGATHWSAKPLADLVGLDTAALAQYLTANSYLKASDISNYLTWANLSGKPTVYPTSWELVTGRPTKLSDLTDDVVSGNYLPKPTWDAVFEVVTVDGTPALKVKYDILGLKGITAYSDGTLSGGFSGALVDLVDVAVTNLASGDILKYNGTHFVNVPVSSIAGASSWDQITGKPDYFPTRWADVSGAPTSLPASDVYPWAKAATKPTYTAAEVGAVALNGGGDVAGSINASGYLTANTLRSKAALYPTISFVKTNDNSESLLIVAGNNLYYRPVASDATNKLVYHSGNFNPSSKLDKSVWDEAFELKTVNGVRVLNVKLDIAGLKGISAYGLGSTSGSGASGSLGELVNVGQWADEAPAADRVMVQLAGATHWSAKPLADLVGLDTAALAQYLTANSYLKASDISNYLTWANLSGKPTVYPTSWELVTGRPTKLSDLTDDVVSGNYLPKPTWDAVFEVVTVDGTPALKVKYDILGLKGITAYSDGTLSGGFSGALVDLVDVAVTNLASGDILKYNGTHFVNVPVSSIAGASSWDQITGKPDYFPTRWADVSGAPTSLPASDVYPWAKAATKPTYTAAEVGAVALNGGGDVAGSINASGYLTANTLRSKAALYPTISFVKTNDNSESLLIVAGNNLYYRPVASDATNKLVYHSGNFNPSSKLDKSVWDEAFELKTVNGVRVISAKLDFLSVAGISAYATGPSSGGGGGGLDYDLLKQALTGAITPDGYPFTISASFLGAIDKTYLTGKLANTYANKVHTHLWVDITDRPTALPANGGNADTVDNLHASSFAQIKSYNFPSGGVNNITDLDFTGNIQAHFPGAEYSCIWQGKDFAGTILQLKLRDYAGKQSMMYRGSLTKTWRTVWDSGNFNPANYLPLSGGSITGGLGVSGYLTAGVLKINETGSVYPQILFTGNNGNSSLLFVNAILRELVFRPADGVANDGIVYHSKNLTKLSQLTNDVVPSWALATTNHHLPYDDTRNTNYAPYNSNIPKGLTTVHLKTTGIDGLADGGNFHSSIYITPWIDTSGGHAHNIAFTDNGNMWMRHGTASWSEWVKVYHSGNFNPDNYLPLSGGKMITGDFQFKDGVAVRDDDSKNIIGLLNIAGDGVCVAVGNGIRKTRIVTPDDTPVYRNDSKGTYRIYDSGNSNISTVDWAAKNITAAGTVTATKLVLGGITIDVYNGALRVNGNLVATGGVTSLATA